MANIAKNEEDYVVNYAVEDLNLSHSNEETLSFLIESKDDMIDFLTNFWLGEEYQFESVQNYKDFKADKLNVTFGLFMILRRNKGLKYACETLFLQPIDNKVLELLEKKLKDGTLTMEQLYLNRDKNILQLASSGRRSRRNKVSR